MPAADTSVANTVRPSYRCHGPHPAGGGAITGTLQGLADGGQDRTSRRGY